MIIFSANPIATDKEELFIFVRAIGSVEERK
jgi:hypothetical protein